MSDTEEKFSYMVKKLPNAHIELNNRNHQDKIIQLLILLQQVQAPMQIAKGEQLFKKFTASDIASILHLHFDAFRDNKLNTIQRKVGIQFEHIKPTNSKVKRLTEALQDFFY